MNEPLKPSKSDTKRKVNGSVWQWIAGGSATLNLVLASALATWWIAAAKDVVPRMEINSILRDHTGDAFAHESETARRQRVIEVTEPMRQQLNRIEMLVTDLSKLTRDLERKVDRLDSRMPP